MNFRIPIVVVAYNRPESLKRLLSSLSRAAYPSTKGVELIISIDYSGDTQCEKIANEYQWEYGEKKVIQRQENLGLRDHILSCGSIALENDGIILLEDDTYVGPDFYNYVLQAYQFYKQEPRLAGISLYAFQLNENAYMPFQPLADGYDGYFMQVPSSWGQFWSNEHWRGFLDFYQDNPEIGTDDRLPENVKNWPETSWKKYFYKYMVDKDLYFLYPQQSHSTNFGEKGEHFENNTSLFQVSLSNAIDKEYMFLSFDRSNIKYDAYFELLPRCLKSLGFSFKDTLTIDTYGTKQLNFVDTNFVLTCGSAHNYSICFGVSMKPILNNIIYQNKGEGLSIVHKNNFLATSCEKNKTDILENHFPIPFQRGAEKGFQSGYEAAKQRVLKFYLFRVAYSLKKRFTQLIDYF